MNFSSSILEDLTYLGKKEYLMIIIFGSRSRKKNEMEIPMQCRMCPEPSLWMISLRRWATLFFIPIFPCGSKKHYLECQSCENAWRLTDEQAVSLYESVENNQG